MGEKDFMNQLGTDLDFTSAGVSPNEIDFGHSDPDKGEGTPLEVEVTIKTALAGTSITFSLEHATAAGGSYTTLTTTRSYTAAELTSGALVKIPLPDKHQRALRLAWTPTSITAGTGDAYLQPA